MSDQFNSPWGNENSAVVLDLHYANPINWDTLKADPKAVGIIHKASQGLRKDPKFAERRKQASENGILWGSYHLLTKQDIDAQLDFYLSIADDDDATYALDVECIDAVSGCRYASMEVSLAQIEAFLDGFKARKGYFPLLYMNDSVRKVVAAGWKGNPQYANVPLWYARFKSSIQGVFPDRHWQTYTLWQFCSEINCSPGQDCLYSIAGFGSDMDYNVFWGSPEELKQRWPLRG